MNVLVTGAGGFIGSHLVESQLAQGHQVRAVDIHFAGLAHLANQPKLELAQADITEAKLVRQLVEGMDVIYHLASAHLDVSLPASRYRRVNVTAAVELVRAAHAAHVRRMVHCSSVGVIGEVKHPPADESTACHPTNIYEQSKWLGEQAVRKLAKETGAQVVVVRPTWAYGPRCPRMRKLYRAVQSRRFIMFGSGATLRHPVYVTDVVRGLELCAERDVQSGQVYIVGGDKVITIEGLVRLIAVHLNVDLSIIHLPVAVGLAAGYAVQLAYKPLKRQPPLSRRSMDFFVKDSAFEIGKAQRELGYQPQVDLQTGLATTLNWLKVHAHA